MTSKKHIRTNTDKNELKTVRIIRVARIFSQTPISVILHTEDGRHKKIKINDWDMINVDTGCINENGWKFLEAEAKRVYGENVEWTLKTLNDSGS